MRSMVAACIAAFSIAGCAVAPSSDGGIVGTGNRIDCEEQVKKDGTRVPPPPECNRPR
jgi:hypothetical protein